MWEEGITHNVSKYMFLVPAKIHMDNLSTKNQNRGKNNQKDYEDKKQQKDT